MPERPRPLLVGKFQADLLGQHRATQVDLHKPLAYDVTGIGFPESRRITINDASSRSLAAAGFPDTARDLATGPRRVAKERRIGNNIGILVVLDQLQLARIADFYQAVRNLPAFPVGRAIEGQALGLACSGTEQ